MKVGLTGSIGSGKSTVLQVFAEIGWNCLDTDRLARGELETAEVVREIGKKFGAAVLNEEGGIDRRKLGERVFSDDDALDWLERLLHPRIREKWTSALSEQPEADWVVEVPLLFEKKLENRFDFSVTVHCPESLQYRRLREKGLDDRDIRFRLARQMSSAEKERRADFVLTNSGTLAFLKNQVMILSDRLRGR